MPYSEYAKPFRNNSNLVTHLIGKGLGVASVPEAEDVLKKINYYRFKIYLRPFLDVPTNRFRGPADFKDGIALYNFDRELREFLFSTIGRLEVKLRSRLDQVVTEHTNNPFWYLDDSLFQQQKKSQINSVRSKIHDAFQRSTDDFVNHFRTNYVNAVNPGYKHLPPFWIAAELTTFGNIPILYEALDKAQFVTVPRGNKLDHLAQEFGASNLQILNGWLKGLRDVRNRCAHHSRVWNCNYREPAAIRRMIASTLAPSHNNRIYLLLVLIHIMSNSIGLDAQMKRNLLGMIGKYGVASRFFWSMGIPNSWETDPIWA